jgi:hypothetical protein
MGGKSRRLSLIETPMWMLVSTIIAKSQYSAKEVPLGSAPMFRRKKQDCAAL